ncbi:MCE family protein [Nocardioides dongxiaopingii]|uniref:MCE family protein n=1 Tax=Nocardioides sp. S-1144 TaxID=2582905 RepID=UPI001162062B|nr:MCE family protein [Nocardioides sp. S-1144]QDH11093.1 MCE family protein [Nocardioides sp. S-1144]
MSDGPLSLRRAVVPLVLLMLVVAAGLTLFQDGEEDKTVTAWFPRTVSLYEGSDVRVLGVPVGKVESITPEGTRVKVVMTYDPEVQLPRDAKAVLVSPAIVGDRYVQLTPAYTGGAEMADGAELEALSQVPLELDEIYSSLDRLTVALGPNGANADGALTDLLQVTADNFGGQGEQFNQTVKDVGRLSETLDDNKEELFGAAAELQKFITTLADNDTTVRDFNDSLGRVSTLLAGEREELAGSLRNLGIALDQVSGFVRENREILSEDITGLNRVAKVLVKQRKALDETLRIAPLALNNLQLTYNPDTGTLDTNANISNLVNEITSDPAAVLCALVSANDDDGKVCDLIQTLPLPRAATFGPGTGSLYENPSDPTLGGFVPSGATGPATTTSTSGGQR